MTPSPKRYAHPAPVNVIFLGKSISADISKLRISKWDLPGLSRWVLNPKTSFLIRRLKQKRKKHRREGNVKKGNRDWCDVSTGQEMPGFASSQPPEATRETWNCSRSESPEGTNSADTLIFNFWPLGLWENKSMLLLSQQVCGNLWGQSWETNIQLTKNHWIFTL